MDIEYKNDNYTYQNSTIRRLGYAVWLTFGILSIVFYKERSLFMDGAFQLFDLINTEEFSIHHYRITNPLTQILPWIGVKMSLPLKYVMMGYSINFILFHTIIYHLIVKWCKNDFLGLVQIGFFTLFVTESFYFLPPEFYQGMSILLLWIAILLNPSWQNPKWKFPLLCLLLILIIFDHLLLSFFFLYAWIFLWFHDKRLRNRQFYGLLVFMFIVYFVHDAYFTGWYDEARKGHFWKHWNQYYPHFENIPGHKIFLHRCLDTYYLFPILMGIIIYGYVRSAILKTATIKAPLPKLFLLLGFSFFYILINHINDPLTPSLFYSQVNYMGLAIPIMIILSFDFLPPFCHKKYVSYLIGILLITRLCTITYTSKRLIDRQNWMLEIMQNANSNKLVFNNSDAPINILIQTWSIPEETLLLSSLEGPDNSATLLSKRSDFKFPSDLDSTNLFLRSQSIIPIADMNPTYFNLGDSLYQKIQVKPDQ